MELLKALYDKLTGIVSLQSKIKQSDNSYGVYFYVAPSKATMPYIVISLPSHSTYEVFEKTEDLQDVLAQITIFTKDRSEKSSSDIRDIIMSNLNRATLTYTTFLGAGCKRENELPPVKIEDYWQRSIIFRIRYQEKNLLS